VFSKPGSDAISNKYVAVLLLGGNDIDDEGRAFAKKYGVGGYPTLLALTHDGAVVNRSIGRSRDGILEAMAKAQTNNEEFLAEKTDLEGKKDAESLRTLGTLYLGRSQLDEAKPLLAALLATDKATAEDRLSMLDLQKKSGDKEGAVKTRADLIAKHADHEDYVDWRMEAATADIAQPTSRDPELRKAYFASYIGALNTLLADLKDKNHQAIVRFNIGGPLSQTDKQGALDHLEWILANAPESKVAKDAIFNTGIMRWQVGKEASDLAKIKSGKELLEKYIEDNGSSRKASYAKQRLLPQIDADIEKLEAAAADDDADDEDADDADDADDEGGSDEDGDDKDKDGDK